MSSGLAWGCGLLLHKLKCAGASHKAETYVPCPCALGIFELRLDVVAVFLALVGEDSAGILPGGDNAVGGQLGPAVRRNLACDQQVAGIPAVPCSARKLLLSMTLGNCQV